jgi:hypothetical protein
MRAALVMLAACASAPPAPPSNVVKTSPPVDPGCKPPSDWHADEMAKAAFNLDAPPGHIRIVAWKQTIDDRPLRIDSGLVWIKPTDGAAMIGHVYRHPDDKPADWHHAMIYDRPGFESSIVLSAHPTHDELDTFFTATDWQFDAEQDFKLVSSGLCAQAWRDSFGEPPWHAFPPHH